jgi:hypothetical protein
MLPPDDPHGYTSIFKGLTVTVGLLLFLALVALIAHLAT